MLIASLVSHGFTTCFGQCGSHLKKWVTLDKKKRGHTWKNQSKLVKWVTLRKKSQLKKCDALEALQGEPLAPIFGLGVNPFSSRSINRPPRSVSTSGSKQSSDNHCFTTCTRSGWGKRGQMSRRIKIAHLLIGQVKKRIWKVKRSLATAVKGENRQNEMLPRLRRPHSLKGKAKRACFYCSRFNQEKYDTFRGKKPF